MTTEFQQDGYYIQGNYPDTLGGNASLNLSELNIDLGPKRDSLDTVIPMTLVYGLLLVTGVIGNICTCVVITRNKYMHTATNYYLFSLAVSDLLLLVSGLPQEIYQLWIKYPYAFGEFFCIFRGLTSETSTNASILTITSFTVERYVAICHPLRAHTMSKLSRAVKFILVVWICGALCAVPLAIQFGIVYVELDDGELLEESAACSVKRPLSHAFELSTFIFFFLPMTVISVLYVFIGIRLRRSEHIAGGPVGSQSCNGVRRGDLNSDGVKSQHRNSLKAAHASRRAVVKMLVAVVVAFFVCWAPFHAQRLMAIYVTQPTTTDEKVYNALLHISGVSYYVSATINPILYSIISLKFRKAFKETLASCCGLGPRRTRNSARSSSRLTRRSTVLELVTDIMTSETRNPNQASTPRLIEEDNSSSISNSSLQMVDEDAFDGTELRNCIAQLKK